MKSYQERISFFYFQLSPTLQSGDGIRYRFLLGALAPRVEKGSNKIIINNIKMTRG